MDKDLNTMVKDMNYTEAVEYILSVPKFTKKNKMENTVELMELSLIHI